MTRKVKYLNQKGFTLVEILIVIVILAIMAAFALPRLLSQPEQAHIGEGQNILGVLRRGQQNYMDVNGVDSVLALTCTVAGTDTTACKAADLSKIGVKSMPANPRWEFACTGTGCTATRKTGNSATGTIAIDVVSGAYTCAVKYQARTDASQGCEPI